MKCTNQILELEIRAERVGTSLLDPTQTSVSNIRWSLWATREMALPVIMDITTPTSIRWHVKHQTDSRRTVRPWWNVMAPAEKKHGMVKHQTYAWSRMRPWWDAKHDKIDWLNRESQPIRNSSQPWSKLAAFRLRSSARSAIACTSDRARNGGAQQHPALLGLSTEERRCETECRSKPANEWGGLRRDIPNNDMTSSSDKLMLLPPKILHKQNKKILRLNLAKHNRRCPKSCWKRKKWKFRFY
jgi:hypothetical protein